MAEIFQQFIVANSNEQQKIQMMELVKQLLARVDSITEFNERELMAISMLQNDDYLSELLVFYISNKKHAGRKHSKEILEALDKLVKMSQSEPQPIR